MGKKVLPIQNSFAGGVISSRMLARSDTAGYKQAVKDAVNFIVYPQGPIDMRPGTQFMYALTGASRYGRIFPFNVSKTEAYALVVTKDEIRIIAHDLSSNATLTSPYSTDEKVRVIHKGDPPGEDKVILVNGTEAPQHITKGTPFTTGVQALTNAPASWTGSIWPKTVGFGNGRSWFGNISGNKEGYWGSTSGSFYDFDTGTALDDEAIARTIDKRGALQWIVNAKDLTFGTENGVFRVTSSGGVITPSDIQIDKESSRGSDSIQGFDVGNSVIYVSPDGRKLREFKYNFNVGGYVAEDLTFIAEDITKDNILKSIAYAEDPESIIWGHTENGTLLGNTYDFTTKILGWHKHDTFGDIVDVCSLKVNGTNQTWMLIDNGSGLDVVKLGEQYLDHYDTQTETSGTATTSIGPFAHLASEEVHVLVDGANDNKITLDSAGSGTTATAGLEFVVGKSYDEAYFTSLNLDNKSDANSTDSSSSMMKHWNKLFVYILLSALPKINGSRPATRSASTLMGTVEALKTEFVQVATTGHTREGTVTVSQDLPFKTTILAFMGQMSQK